MIGETYHNLKKLLTSAGTDVTALDTATFQRSAEYAPAYPSGRLLAILENMLISALFALYLLAVHRHFRR